MRTLLLFDGLGGSCADLITDLRERYRQPENRAFFSAVCEAVECALDHVGGETYRRLLPAGLPLRSWLRAPAAPPVAPSDSISAGVCTHALQLCQLQPTGRQAVPGATAVGALGLSLGLQAAIVAGLDARRPGTFLDLCGRSMRLVVLALVRGHQLTAADTVDPALVGRYARGRPGAQPPAPMASVTGVGHRALAEAVARHNTRHNTRRPAPATAGRAVEVGLVASPRTQLLSGHTEDLLDFHFAHQRLLDGPGAGWSFLRNTLPFHSARLAPAVRWDARDRGFLGAGPSGAQLRFPVYATDAPRDLRESPDLSAEFVNLMLVRPVDWPATVAHVMDASAPERAIDFGPGPAARMFTRDCLRPGGRRLRFDSGPRASLQGG
ncbi:hypothetical protein OG455_40175 [Kitasatospora sp. NBC_01287]|uniref:hypothetical protein n=1 Tax=Kitasatospora sp. NBC_01287 TaxID=2903573 RepID=UPI0022554DB0|nr:hypothetical protein [Kitasatospora sp. NBC_01287]MCX4751654.1 hypothetical protein [Kitasatospora sp. NBC_01287]